VPDKPEIMVRRARLVATKAINEAAKIALNQDVARSTRTRASYKHKADALDRVARILTGKE